ncbi:MAG: undecaprenyldiphospho-muramoylpentapeptide beta-N-acetylglucosaminyltransferase [Patescibacteria group bacterium]|nr:undecaprenyldiphospho-muramoylpentapeptide beta-N-acetylglucosaminyltransferase [Patescibacteria group bacterium]MDD5121745.1 undecaprenyldiphospho-muramoylpentapeptide beta-N-acetylglucosaminyltransferase [Patescibacteria group bacterium]MDD5396403.1 undecaprenyldiphospho-muramoylpentapeptide beta-N-acetylglucosaminyltransferase [Patescibacteria group bacterium]
MRIILAGGGSSGPVSPLLAIVEKLQQDEPNAHDFLFIGTKNGHPEKIMAEHAGLKYQGIFCGKLRRYFSWKNFIDLFYLKIGFFQSIGIIKKFKPDVIFSAGGFVAVPMTIAGYVCGVPSLIHQQDVLPGLANKIMIPFAKRITVNFKSSLAGFPAKKSYLTGNPVRQFVLSGNAEKARVKFNLNKDLPVLLVYGGGLGAEKINELIWDNLDDLTLVCQIVHLTGKNKINENIGQDNKNYHRFEFLTDGWPKALAVADLIISRAGLGALTELSILGKPTILIPMPDSHQEINAKIYADQGAVVLMSQKNISYNNFFKTIKNLLTDQEERTRLGERMKKMADPRAAEKIIDHLKQICYNK